MWRVSGRRVRPRTDCGDRGRQIGCPRSRLGAHGPGLMSTVPAWCPRSRLGAHGPGLVSGESGGDGLAWFGFGGGGSVRLMALPGYWRGAETCPFRTQTGTAGHLRDLKVSAHDNLSQAGGRQIRTTPQTISPTHQAEESSMGVRRNAVRLRVDVGAQVSALRLVRWVQPL